MSEEIYAALVGGVLAGIVVLAGVLLTEWLQRLRRRRERVEQATLEVVMLVPRLAAALSEVGTTEPSDEHRRLERARVLLGELQGVVRWPMRRRKAMLAAVDNLAAKLTAAEIRFYRGTPLTARDVLVLSDNRLYPLVFPKRRPLDDAIKRYVAGGLAPPSAGD